MKHTLIIMALALITATAAQAQKKVLAAKERAMQSITVENAQAHIGFLASDALNGRKAGTRDSRVAAQYIISLLKQWGIKPMAEHYEQPFSA